MSRRPSRLRCPLLIFGSWIFYRCHGPCSYRTYPCRRAGFVSRPGPLLERQPLAPWAQRPVRAVPAAARLACSALRALYRVWVRGRVPEESVQSPLQSFRGRLCQYRAWSYGQVRAREPVQLPDDHPNRISPLLLPADRHRQGQPRRPHHSLRHVRLAKRPIRDF